MNKGNLIVVSGFSGAGKGTVMNKLISEKEGWRVCNRYHSYEGTLV